MHRLYKNNRFEEDVRFKGHNLSTCPHFNDPTSSSPTSGINDFLSAHAHTLQHFCSAVSLYLSVFLTISHCLSVCLPICESFSPSLAVYRSVSFSFSLSICQSFSLSLAVLLSPYLSLSICQSSSLSLAVLLSPYLSLSVCILQS